MSMWVAGATIVGSVGSALINKSASDKALQAQKDALANVKPADINAINTQAVDTQTANAIAAKKLQAQLEPGVQPLQSASLSDLLAKLQPDQYTEQIKALLGKSISGGSSINLSLLNSAVNSAQQQLDLGGKLDPETQNQIMRAALAKAGSVAPGGLGLGRDITARDLGLNSLQLYQQRLNNASTIGGQQLSEQQAQSQQTLAQQQMLAALAQGDYTRALQIAQFAQGIQTPSLGLSGTDVANISLGKTNQGNQAALSVGNLNAAGDVANGKTYSSILGALTAPKTASAVGSLFNQAVPANAQGGYGTTAYGPGY